MSCIFTGWSWIFSRNPNDGRCITNTLCFQSPEGTKSLNFQPSKYKLETLVSYEGCTFVYENYFPSSFSKFVVLKLYLRFTNVAAQTNWKTFQSKCHLNISMCHYVLQEAKTLTFILLNIKNTTWKKQVIKLAGSDVFKSSTYITFFENL